MGDERRVGNGANGTREEKGDEHSESDREYAQGLDREDELDILCPYYAQEKRGEINAGARDSMQNHEIWQTLHLMYCVMGKIILPPIPSFLIAHTITLETMNCSPCSQFILHKASMCLVIRNNL